MKSVNVELDCDYINNLNLSFCKPDCDYFENLCGQEHYRLLCYISTLFDKELFIDIGTAMGDSALAFGYNPHNNVISFNIEETSFPHINNCKYIIGNFQNYIEDIIKSRCILYDIPHYKNDNEFITFCNRLKKLNWKGFLILDDYKYDPIKNEDWNSLSEEEYEKIDATKYGHFSGTGIINFSSAHTRFILK